MNFFKRNLRRVTENPSEKQRSGPDRARNDDDARAAELTVRECIVTEIRAEEKHKGEQDDERGEEDEEKERERVIHAAGQREHDDADGKDRRPDLSQGYQRG